MKTTVLQSSEPDALKITYETLKAGHLAAFPTDTVYGLAADAFNEDAIQQLFEAKGRDFNKAIAVLVGDLKQAFLLTDELPDTAKILINNFWPGGLTLIVGKLANLPPSLSPSTSIGIRMPDHPLALTLLAKYGPLATTSANISGGKNPQTAADVLAQLDGRIPLILDGGACKGGVPSTVVDCTRSPIAIVRYGAVSETAINKALKIG
ncbi:MAG: L-threonylcarbamoyladenylate synthase [Anaerolineaceae bacterium]|jgi:L-threonylcarbamoyladenylate synthase